MHPVLADRKRLALYLVTWLLLAILLALLVLEPGRNRLRDAIALTVVPTLVYAFFCLSAWYPVRAMPLHTVNAWRLIVTHSVAALVLSGVWLLVFQLWFRVFDAIAPGRSLSDLSANRLPALLVSGALLYLLSVAFHYLLAGIEETRRIEMREIEVRVLAREAELKALKAQLDPHFLFNILNSISSLCGSNPTSARTLTTLLAEYLRKSLRLGSSEAITLSEELELASSYLAIERIRFGPRLEVEQDIEEGVRSYRVPPLLLQPLVENAVTHGIGNLVDGGVVQIGARRAGDRVHIAVENRCDPDRPSRPGEGIGLANTRRRVATFYGGSANVDVMEEPSRFRVTLSLPV